jgi:beta-N-acetylhexosaminidase
MAVRACILGCAGLRFTPEERDFFRRVQPFGLILFKRNIENRRQVLDLTRAFREIVDRDDAPILIDQEGGRVQRLGPPNWPSFPAAARFGELYARNHAQGLDAVRLGARLIAAELAELAINVDCMPVADLRLPQTHDVIGDRAYAFEPDAVGRLARAAADGLLEGGVLPVVKHVPGHGRARADSHKELPVVDAPLAELDRTDFEPFRRLNDLPMAMSAHVVYSAIDPNLPATISHKVIAEVIRDRIGFAGLLMSDDLSMQALSGSLGTRARAALAAGCDVVLHCNGRFPEMQEVAEAAPPLAGAAGQRADAALSRLKPAPKTADLAEAHARFSAMIGA